MFQLYPVHRQSSAICPISSSIVHPFYNYVWFYKAGLFFIQQLGENVLELGILACDSTSVLSNICTPFSDVESMLGEFFLFAFKYSIMTMIQIVKQGCNKSSGFRQKKREAPKKN